MRPIEDPGWRPALRVLPRMIYPPLLMNARGPILHTVRAMYLGAPLTWLMFFVVLASLRPEATTEDPWPIVLVVVSGILSVALRPVITRKEPNTQGLLELAADLRARHFVGWALFESPVLVGFVAFFMAGAMLPYAIGVVFGVIGLAQSVPTAAELDRWQQRVRQQNSSLSVRAALMLPASGLPRRRPR